MMLFLIQTKSRTLSPVLKHASTYGMDSVSGKMNSGCLILKVRNDLFSQGTLTAAWLAQVVERQSAVREVEGSSPRSDQHSGS